MNKGTTAEEVARMLAHQEAQRMAAERGTRAREEMEASIIAEAERRAREEVKEKMLAAGLEAQQQAEEEVWSHWLNVWLIVSGWLNEWLVD